MTMEHLFTILLGIFTLSAGLQAKPVDSDLTLELLGTLICDKDALFYTPDNTGSCAYSCFETELDTMKAECADTEGQRLQIDLAKDFLNKAQDGTTNPKDCDCEKWPQRPVKEFLLKIEEMRQIEKSKL